MCFCYCWSVSIVVALALSVPASPENCRLGGFACTSYYDVGLHIVAGNVCQKMEWACGWLLVEWNMHKKRSDGCPRGGGLFMSVR